MAPELAAGADRSSAMPLLTDQDIAVLQEACRLGVLKVKVAGKASVAEQARAFERCKSAAVLKYLGFLEPLPDDGTYARWRPVAGCRAALEAVIAERRGGRA